MVLASLVRVFLAHPDMEEAVHAKQDRENMPSISGLSSSSSKATRIITKAPYSWPHLTLITSQRLCLKNTTLNFSIKFVTHTHCGNAFKPSRALLELTDWQNTRIPHKSFRALMEPPSLLIGHDHWWLEILDSGGRTDTGHVPRSLGVSSPQHFSACSPLQMPYFQCGIQLTPGLHFLYEML